MSEMTVEQFAAAQADEYGTYVATEPIVLGGARAFNVGDPVPKSHVDRGVVDKSQVGPAPVPSDERAAVAPVDPQPVAPDAKASKDKPKPDSVEGNA